MYKKNGSSVENGHDSFFFNENFNQISFFGNTILIKSLYNKSVSNILCPMCSDGMEFL